MSTQIHEGHIPQWTVNDRLRKAREHADLEQAQLAEAIGVSRATISNYESGRVGHRKLMLNAWALATGVPVTWLLNGETPTGDGPDGGGKLPRLDSNQQPFG